MTRFKAIELQQLLRSKNSHADALANVASNVNMVRKMDNTCGYFGRTKHNIA